MTTKGSPVFVTELPATFKGVYFLSNGFHWCVDRVPGAKPPGVVQVKRFDGSVPCSGVKLIWSNDRERFDRYVGAEENCASGASK